MSPTHAKQYPAILALAFCQLLLTISAAAQSTQSRYEYKARHMGIVARIVVYAPSEPAARDGAGAAFDRIAELEDIFSNYRHDSEVSRLVAAPVGQPVRCSTDLLRVLSRVDTLWRASGGAFDPSVGPYTELWREARAEGKLPSDARLADARGRSGWDHVSVDLLKETVTLSRSGMAFDLGGIAKGYAGDEALRVLAARGLGSALVELGGEIVVGDPPPGRKGWQIDGTEYAAVENLELANAAVSTSGDSQQFVEIDGRRYSHIIDPRSGMGLTNGVTVTVVARDGFTADGLSTTISIVGQEEGRVLAELLFPGSRVYVKGAAG